MADRVGPQVWHPEDIKAALRKQHGAITHLSVAWGYARGAITNALARPDYSPAIELRIAEALNLSPYALWPDRWTPAGRPRPRSVVIAAQASRAATFPHRQKARLA